MARSSRRLSRNLQALWLVGMAALVAAAWGLRRYLRSRPDVQEIERRRLFAIHRNGKIAEGEVIDFDGASVVFNYIAAGVEYTASQDLSSLQAHLNGDAMSLLGQPVSVRHEPRNPANSMVLCEAWSGLRLRRATSASPQASSEEPVSQ